MHQQDMPFPVSLPAEAYRYGDRKSGETHGVVLTKPHVVELILDLANYRPERDLGDLRLLEPSCGRGAFLGPVVQRLLDSAEIHNRDPAALAGAITAFDIDGEHVVQSRRVVTELLQGRGVPAGTARDLARQWINQGDFLLAPIAVAFDAVVGNPPYIRIEQLTSELQSEYRARFQSLYDRADVYVAFIERGLRLLASQGILSYVCADRWVLNRYGAPLRRLIAKDYGVRYYIDLHQASPFGSEVVAYPAIFAIAPGSSKDVAVGAMRTASVEECSSLRAAVGRRSPTTMSGVNLVNYPEWFAGDAPWVITSPEHLSVLRELEARFQALEDEGARVGIGVATGNDKVYIVDAEADIESDRLVPLLKRSDIERGRIRDAGRFVINTFDHGGRVIDLQSYPRLSRYLESQGRAVRGRHVARKNPRAWFRTIDRVYPELVEKPKLVIPDIAGSNEVAFDEGRFHPHHNLYFVTSDKWDLEVLGGLLSSRMALFFIWSYAVKMRGGYLRFQAQYLRRIRVPDPGSLSNALTRSIRSAFRKRDFARLDQLCLEAYGLDELPDFDFVDTRE